MYHEANENAHDACAALLDLDRAIRAEMAMISALAAHPGLDAIGWDDFPDADTIVGLGAPLTREESFFDDTEFDPLPDDDGLDDLEVTF